MNTWFHFPHSLAFYLYGLWDILPFTAFNTKGPALSINKKPDCLTSTQACRPGPDQGLSEGLNKAILFRPKYPAGNGHKNQRTKDAYQYQHYKEFYKCKTL